MVTKSDDMSHDPFSANKHPKTPSLPRLNDIGDTAFTLSQRVADENGKLVPPSEVAENPADVPFPKESEEDFEVPSGDPTQPPVEKTATPEEELTVEEQLNFNLTEEENK